jgi:hypothetical protein
MPIALPTVMPITIGRTTRTTPGWTELRDSWRVAHASAGAAGPDDGLFGNAMHYAARDGGQGRDTEDPSQAALIREILGDPLQEIVVPPEWRTSAAVALAKQMHDRRDFSAAPILADALQDAGCEDQSILDHLRGPGQHVCGCWACDLVLSVE